LVYRGRRLRVEVTREGVRYEVTSGNPLEVLHHGEHVRLEQGEPVTLDLPPVPEVERPAPPPGRPVQRYNGASRVTPA
jgi:alpha,alpha-trehalose phosphorylase